MHTNTNK